MCGSLLKGPDESRESIFFFAVKYHVHHWEGMEKQRRERFRRHPLVSGEPRKKLVVELLCQITTHSQPNSRSGEAVAIAHLGANEKSSTENYCSKSLLIVTGLGEPLAEKLPSFSFPQAAFLP